MQLFLPELGEIEHKRILFSENVSPQDGTHMCLQMKFILPETLQAGKSISEESQGHVAFKASQTPFQASQLAHKIHLTQRNHETKAIDIRIFKLCHK